MTRAFWQKRTVVGVWSIIGVAFGAWILDLQLTNGSGRFRLTADQALEGSERLCGIILPHSGTLKLQAEPIVRLKKDGSDDREWKVDCFDSAGKDVLHLVWSAETGDLCLVESTGRTRAVSAKAKLSRAQGRQSAEYWIQALKIFAQDQTYYRLEAEMPTSGIWRFKFGAGDRIADIAIEANSGALIEAKMDQKFYANSSAANRDRSAGEANSPGKTEIGISCPLLIPSIR